MPSATKIVELLRFKRPEKSGKCDGCGAEPVALWYDIMDDRNTAYCVNCWRDEMASMLHTCDDDCRSDGCQFRLSEEYHSLMHAPLDELEIAGCDYED